MLRKDKYKMTSVVSNGLLCIDKDKKINVIDYYFKEDLCEEEYKTLDVTKYFPNTCAVIKLVNLYANEYKLLNNDIDYEYIKNLVFKINTYYDRIIADNIITYHLGRADEVI